MRKPRIATCWLDGCSSYHMSVLDADERIAALLSRADLVYGPLVDAQEFPDDVDIALVEGAVSSQDDLKLARAVRERSRVVVALGDCAVTSNVPSMRNGIAVRRILERVYVEGADERPGAPVDGVPPLLRHAVPLHDVVDVDVHLPGCPPPTDLVLFALGELLEGRRPSLDTRARFG